MKQIKEKQNRQSYDPTLTHKWGGGAGVYLITFLRLPVHGFFLPPNTLKSSKSNNKGDKSQKHKICDFVTPV